MQKTKIIEDLQELNVFLAERKVCNQNSELIKEFFSSLISLIEEKIECYRKLEDNKIYPPVNLTSGNIRIYSSIFVNSVIKNPETCFTPQHILSVISGFFAAYDSEIKKAPSASCEAEAAGYLVLTDVNPKMD